MCSIFYKVEAISDNKPIKVYYFQDRKNALSFIKNKVPEIAISDELSYFYPITYTLSYIPLSDWVIEDIVNYNYSYKGDINDN